MTTDDAIHSLEAAILSEPPDGLLRLLGELARLKAMADAVFSRPEPPDRLLTAEEAAPILNVSPATLYRKADRLPFSRREGRLVRFSARGLQEHMRRAKT